MFHEFRPRPLEKNGQQDGRESGQEGEVHLDRAEEPPDLRDSANILPAAKEALVLPRPHLETSMINDVRDAEKRSE